MMSEIKQIESVINPTETFLVADSLTGQVAASVAKEFKNTVNLSGIILTRADGDARGGAAVSMKYVSNVPIKFLGIGEKIDDLETTVNELAQLLGLTQDDIDNFYKQKKHQN